MQGKPRISDRKLGAYRLQGKYLSALRPLSTQARAKIEAI
jgi:hypothetical protein